jgi:uncharacterized membrane protein
MNFAVFLEAPLIIQVHALSAIGALVVGLVQFLGPKGNLPHRMLGYLFVGLMITTASTAIFIRQINDGNFSPIHIFVPLTFIGLFGLVRSAMRRDGSKHRREVSSLMFGALMIPGLFAFIPGRLMWQVAFGG